MDYHASFQTIEVPTLVCVYAEDETKIHLNKGLICRSFCA